MTDNLAILQQQVANLLAWQARMAQAQSGGVDTLSDLSDDLGDVRAGRFLALITGVEPTDADASGSFVSADGETFPEGKVHIGGVNNGDLQFGLSAVDGSALFGAGNVKLDKFGTHLPAWPEIGVPEATPTPTAINWHDPNTGNLLAQLMATNGANLWFIKASDLSVHQVAFAEDIPTIPPSSLPLGTRRFIYIQGSAAAYAASGAAAPTTSGTLSALPGTSTMYVNHATSASAAATGGIVSTYNLTRMNYHPRFKCRITTGSVITNLRIWIGLFSALPGNVDDLGTPGNFVGFRFSTVAGDTCWRACGAGNLTGMILNSPANALPAMAASTEYLFEIEYDPDALIHYTMWVNGVQAAFSPIPLITPVGTTNLGYVCYAITTTATAKNLAISDVFIEFD